jgi:hypothetical protein
VSPISTTSFDQAIQQLELDLGLVQETPIDLDQDELIQDLGQGEKQDGPYGPVANGFYSQRSKRRIDRQNLEIVPEEPFRRPPNVFQEVAPLFHSNSSSLKAKPYRLSVDGANLEAISDSFQPLPTIGQAMRYSSIPSDYQTSPSPGSAILQRSKLVNFNRRAPQRLQNRRMSEQPLGSPLSDVSSPRTPTTPSIPIELRLQFSLKASPQQLPRLVIPKSKRPPVEAATATIETEESPPVPELCLDTPNSPVRDDPFIETLSSKLPAQVTGLERVEELSGEIIDLDSAVSGTQQHLDRTMSSTLELPILSVPDIHTSPRVLPTISPSSDTEVYFTIADYYTNDSPFGSDDFDDSPLSFLYRKEAHPTYSPFPNDDHINIKEQEQMGLQDFVKNILRRSHSQRRNASIWSRKSSNASDSSTRSPLYDSPNSSWANRSVRNSLPPTPGIDSGLLTCEIQEQDPHPKYRSCTACGDLFNTAKNHSNSTAHCRHEPDTCPGCLSHWIRAKIDVVGHDAIQCPHLTCRFILTAEDVHAVANPETMEL